MRKRLIIQSGDEGVAHYLDLAGPHNAEYAERCDADYQRYNGVWEQGVPPAWNRIPMMLDAFHEGYRQVLWLDADTLAVDHSVNVFEQAMTNHEGRVRTNYGVIAGVDTITAPFVMRRTAGGFHWPMDGPDQWEGWNDGVLLVNRSDRALEALLALWGHRGSQPLPHHQPRLWELNWLLDYAKANPGDVAEMDQRFNWQPFNGASPEQYAVIKAWHGLPHSERWEQMSACVAALNEGRSAVARVRDTTPKILR